MRSTSQCAFTAPSSPLDSRPHSTAPSALTDALITGIAKGSQAYKLVGSYVSTPLNWYVRRL